MARSTDRGPDRELSKRDRPARKKPRRPPKTGHRLALGEQIEDPNEYGVRVSSRSPCFACGHLHVRPDGVTRRPFVVLKPHQFVLAGCKLSGRSALRPANQGRHGFCAAVCRVRMAQARDPARRAGRFAASVGI